MLREPRFGPKFEVWPGRVSDLPTCAPYMLQIGQNHANEQMLSSCCTTLRQLRSLPVEPGVTCPRRAASNCSAPLGWYDSFCQSLALRGQRHHNARRSTNRLVVVVAIACNLSDTFGNSKNSPREWRLVGSRWNGRVRFGFGPTLIRAQCCSGTAPILHWHGTGTGVKWCYTCVVLVLSHDWCKASAMPINVAPVQPVQQLSQYALDAARR